VIPGEIVRWGLCLAAAYCEFAAECHAGMPEHLRGKQARPERNGNAPGALAQPE